MHNIRRSIPKTWPISKKEKPYIVFAKSSHPKKYSLPLLVLIRDILKISQTAGETKKIVRAGEIEVNGRIIKNEKIGVGIFDIMHIKKIEKSFVMILDERGHIQMKEIKDNKKRISKIIGKKILNKNCLQINLFGGTNFLTKEKYDINDSVLIDTAKNQIMKHLPLKKDAIVFIMAGKWIGKTAKIENLTGDHAEIKLENKTSTKIPIKNLVVIDKEQW